MTGLVTSGTSKQSMAARWMLAAALAVAVHGAPIAAWSFWMASDLPPGVEDPPIAVELAMLPSAPSLSEPEQEVTPGPQSSAQEKTAPPPEEMKPEEAAPLAIAPTPQEPEPEIVIPEKKQDAKPEKTPQPEVKKAERPAPKSRIVKEAKRAPQEQSASRESAPARANRNDAMASAVAGQAGAAAASYRARVLAHLQNFKQKVAAAGGGTAAGFTFTIARSGQVTSARVHVPSGNSALDAEAVAMVRRASPFPAFPAEMTQSSVTYQLKREITR